MFTQLKNKTLYISIIKTIAVELTVEDNSFFSFNETLKMYTTKYFINNFGSFYNLVIRFGIGL